ncbi:cell division protein FtsI [Prochlorothrix hollandica PCC 9006 = CALU 1027]|uniref:Cell division protein FtsI n=1 Tax=Prochlorothrix hollandica PCC 9006 = CALU 1027 TaxID=317619 RepID=A0A0M2PNS6_PROHO|nr:cell division protein FtsI [Prochlorothrix hollandica PCC 9006 = CALU 1027]
MRNRTRRSRRTPALLPPPQPVHQFRLFITWLLLVLGMGGMGYRLYYLQIRDTANLLERANAQQNTVLHPVLPRRQIVDRFGTVLALDQPRYSLYAHPTLFSESLEDVATGLAPLLQGGGMETDAATLLAQFMSQDSGIRLSDSLPESVADSIRNLGWNGLDLEKHQQRIYPNGTLFSQILGYVDWEGTAQNGLEASELARLTRSKPDTTARRMGNGTLLPDNLPLDFLAQDTLKLQLTLDSRLQQATQTILQAQLDKFAAKRGAVIIMDVRDGSLLALATLPTYDANHYYDANFDYFRNWALSDLYEPGSTFKPLNVAIALELGGIQAEDTIYDEGQIQVGGWPIANHDFESAGGHGVLSITEVLKYSSNMGMVHIIQSLDPGQYHDALTRLGIGQPLETDLPQVATGYLKSREVMTTSSADRATTSFGQGLTVTPLQMVQLHGALANGGRRVTPHIIQGLVDSKGEQQWTPDYPETDVFKPETTRKVLDMMEAVVRDSTQVATIPGYRIGGKTGTAQKAENGVYIAGAKITSFVGIVPIEQPRYVVFAVVDEPQGANTFGSTVAAPVVRQVMETLTLLYGVQPSDPQVVGTNPPGAIE